jgi:hypothetical protein
LIRVTAVQPEGLRSSWLISDRWAAAFISPLYRNGAFSLEIIRADLHI